MEIFVVIIAILLLCWGFVIDYRNHKKYNPPKKDKDPFQDFLDGLK